MCKESWLHDKHDTTTYALPASTLGWVDEGRRRKLTVHGSAILYLQLEYEATMETEI